MEIIISWDQFSNKIDELVIDSKNILEGINDIKAEEDIEKHKELIKVWSSKGQIILRDSFEPANEAFAREFYFATQSRFNLPNQRKPLLQIKKELIEDLKAKENTLIYYRKILSISDAIIHPEIVALGSRIDMTTEEVLFFILDKLYDLYDNNYHSVRMILDGNGIALKREGEDRELANLLEINGYVDTMHTRDANARLTIQGKIHVEDKRKSHTENYENVNGSQDEINQKIDEIMSKLAKLGFGQEIIFDEIEELKNLYPNLSKKNWGQIVKGKLIDLALSKLIDNDTVEYIYKTLVNHKFHLP